MRRMRTGKEEVRGDSNRSQNSRGSPPNPVLEKQGAPDD